MYVITAFINGTLEERYSCSSQLKREEHLVIKLKCSLYGLKQAPCCWNSILDGYLKQLDVKDLGAWHFYLGMKIIQDNSTGDVWILNNHKVLEKFGAKSVATPTDPNTKLMKDKDKIYQAGV